MRYADFLEDSALTAYAQALNARAKSLHLRGKLKVAELRDCILSSGGRCAWCGTDLRHADFELDHILPLARGGKHHYANLAFTCPACNRAKADKSPLRFAHEQAAQGKLTPLVQRLLSEHGDSALVQRQLFEPTPASLSAPPAEVQTPPHPTSTQADDPDEPPMYRW